MVALQLHRGSLGSLARRVDSPGREVLPGLVGRRVGSCLLGPCLRGRRVTSCISCSCGYSLLRIFSVFPLAWNARMVVGEGKPAWRRVMDYLHLAFRPADPEQQHSLAVLLQHHSQFWQTLDLKTICV